MLGGSPQFPPGLTIRERNREPLLRFTANITHQLSCPEFHPEGCSRSEATCRYALEHALKLRGRGLHVSVYSHYLRTFHLAAMRELAADKSNQENP